MSKTTPASDPTAAFRDLVTQWERGFNSMANSVMGTGAFSNWMNQMQSAQLAQQKAYREFMARQLADANIPTRDELMRVAESVRTLDSRLERIERSLAILASAHEEAPAKPEYHGPPRTRKPKNAQPVVARDPIQPATPTLDQVPTPAPVQNPIPRREPVPAAAEANPDCEPTPIRERTPVRELAAASVLGEAAVVTTTPETFVQYADQVADQFQGVAV